MLVECQKSWVLLAAAHHTCHSCLIVQRATYISAFPGGAAQPAAIEAPVVEQTEFGVVLEGFDASTKIKVIKEIRALSELGLKEAKELVDAF